MLSFFTGAKTEEAHPAYDIKSLDASMNLLKAVTADLCNEANNTVTYLEKTNKRIASCFEAANTASDYIILINKYGKIFFCNDAFLDTCKVCPKHDTSECLHCDRRVIYELGRCSYGAAQRCGKCVDDDGFDFSCECAGVGTTGIWEVVKFEETFGEIWSLVSSDHIWTGKCFFNGEWKRMTIVPIMNGKSTPLYYNCVIKRIQNGGSK